MLNEVKAEQSTDDFPPPEPHVEEELPDEDPNLETAHLDQLRNENPDIAGLAGDLFLRLFNDIVFSCYL